MEELAFENDLIQYLSTGAIATSNVSNKLGEEVDSYIIKSKLWQYKPDIKTTDQLWDNFKKILEQHNQNTLNHELSTVEFNQVKQAISNLKTPYLAGQFLYGLNGVSQLEVDLDDGRHVFLTVFDQKKIGAGDTVYQIVNQIERPAVIAGKPNRRFDTTLLINGLPIIQIEEKRDTHDVDEALNQMHQYILENQYHDIFSTLQILVGITPNNAKYMANTTADKFNKDFAFNWQRKENNQVVRNWKEFADSVLSIPMAHQMATNYMILDGTKNKQMLKVMRPYQVYATQEVINRLKHVDFDMGTNKVGYVWHTTGSGKTITSFKTAWLASRMPKIDKVVFVVDRIALTQQTFENYRAYDPDADEQNLGSVRDTKRTRDLSKQLRSKDDGIIVTSVQKLETLVKRKSFKSPDRNIVFIVDEAHRSTGGEGFESIQKAFKRAAWVGYSGTPMFDDTTKGLRTEDIFGPLLHAYTIREAIADRNVLGFKVDFETTIDDETMKRDYLPKFYQELHPTWDQKKIDKKIGNLNDEDMDDAIKPSFYDENPEHVRLVVEDIFKNWRNRSNDGKYNALFTTHVGGNKASTPMAMMYFNEFQRVNYEHAKNGGLVLKVAVTFSQSTNNSDGMIQTNENLSHAINAYNDQFGTSYGLDDVAGYTQDVTSRLNKTAQDGDYLDLVIVVDQLLTGFDAPELNTLYIDRTLKGAALIQAYSRTNRIADMQEKPWGRIINYRWPHHNEQLMNNALATYANRNSANLSDEERKRQNTSDGITAPEFKVLFEEIKQVVEELNQLTSNFVQLPPSEKDKDKMFDLLRHYNSGIAKLKQFDPKEKGSEEMGFDYDNPDQLIEKLGMSSEQETTLTTVLTNELKEHIAGKKGINVQQLELKLVHIKNVKVNYDYLTELVEQLLNQVHDGEVDAAQDTHNQIKQFANGLEDRNYAKQIINASSEILNGNYPPAETDLKYPVKLKNSDTIIRDANNINLDRKLLQFRTKWGITDLWNNDQMRELFSRHKLEKQDLDDTGQIQDLLTHASASYKELSLDKNVQKLSRIKYRNGLRNAIYKLADQMIDVL